MKNKMFDFDPAAYAPEFAQKGFVFIKKGVTEDFHQILTEQAENYQKAKVLKEFALGNKQQALFEFPDGVDYLRELCTTIGTVCGLDSNQLVLSERHIKAYESDADPNPLAHKDRYASQISVGLSIHVPKGSKLILYPYDDLTINPFNSAADLRASFSPENQPEASLAGAKRVEYFDEPRDVMIFRGNAIWHLRSNAANTTNLYLKLNAFNCDPLGEDPTTSECRRKTLEALGMRDEVLETFIPLIGRRVDYVHRQYTRQWDEVVGVVLWGERHFTIDEEEFDALKAMDGSRNVGSVIARLNGSRKRSDCLAKIRYLAKRGVIDLVRNGD
jgi:hypothetical protein